MMEKSIKIQNNLLLYEKSNCNNRNRLKYFFKFKKKTQILFVFIKLLLILNLNLFLLETYAQHQHQPKIDELNDDLAFPYREKSPQDDPVFVKTTSSRRGSPKTARTTTKTVAKTQSTAKTTTTKSNLKLTPPLIISPSSITPPFIQSTEALNQTHANMFKSWIDTKSTELYELSMNYSGFKLLNYTYNTQLRKDANFAWINFTEMIINISKTISEVLKNKTLIVKNLTDLVEKSFDEYRNDTKRVKDSAYYVYYDAKSPKTFCDVQEASYLRSAKHNLSQTTKINHHHHHSSSTQSSTFPTTQLNIKDPTKSKSTKSTQQENSLSNITGELNEIKFNKKRSFLKVDKGIDEDDLDFIDTLYDRVVVNYHKTNFDDIKLIKDSNHFFNDSQECPYPNIFPHYHQNSNYYHKNKRQVPNQKENPSKSTQRPTRPGGGAGGAGGTSKTKIRKNMTRTTTASPTPPSSTPYYDDIDERTDLEAYDYFLYEYELSEKSPYWNVTCINRTFDENFKNFQKGVNRNQSTIHVPTNVYKQDMDINMTAYWTEALDELFKFNYENDNELFWQYFCSSNGLFRRYPGAYWTVPQTEDFFDCRLQSWYIMAAASPKDVLILLDVSGSMTGLRLEIAKKLVEAIMDTLSDNDFFNILIFSNTVDYLMNKDNETQYRDRFIQAGRTNKKVFIDRLNWYKNTSNIANFDEALIKSFELLLSPNLHTDSCGCNKAIMILTDGASENAENVFKKYNWNNGRKVRVFTFLIGRDMSDPRQVEWMACANDGKFFHVATVADVNEHVHEYIPVLSRPMALMGHHETTWSNVFVGHLDKELKIAVARPAFKTSQSLINKIDLIKKDKDYFKKQKLTSTTQQPTTTETTSEYEPEAEYDNEYQYDQEYDQAPVEEQNVVENVPKDEVTEEKKNDDLKTPEDANEEEDEEIREEENRILMHTDEILRKQQVLLGVVGVDVPVLRLISKVSPKYQMGVGIYIIMLDNNGFIVFHPSIKKEIANSEFNFKGTSNSIDLDRFEIPIGNDEEFEDLEHEMIDQKTNNKTLDNWKREGLRVIRRRTEYVYAPVNNTPFSVAIASPSSFGRYYIDLPSAKESHYEKELKDLMKNKFDSNIQLYNCSYNYSRLTEKILQPKLYMDYCIRYLFSDKDQVLAIKSDLVFHNIYYNLFNFSIFTIHPNLVKSSFYGTYSGITFYLPVTFYRSKMGLTVSQLLSKNYQIPSQTYLNQSNKSSNQKMLPQAQDIEPTTIYQKDMTEPPSEMTINVELGSIIEPLFKTSTKPTLGGNFTKLDSNLTNNSSNESEIFHMSLNLFSTESNKHTYSFEKQYYTRSIEFSDYLRTEFNITDPVVNYFLNESSKEIKRDTVGATIPIWLDKVPTAVTGVVYDAQLLQYFLFENFMLPNCDHITCRNLCSQKRGMNVTCYLVDEHGIVVLSTQERLSKQIKEPVMGQPLYKVNPWLMKTLEYEGIYDLVIPGKELPECFFYKPSVVVVEAQGGSGPTLADRIKMFNNEWRGKNSHCYNFGVYSFNLTKWNTLDSSELRVWCNNSTKNIQRRFLVGYIKYSNLIMLVVEDEFELIYCGNISQLIKLYEGLNDFNSTNDTLSDNSTNLSYMSRKISTSSSSSSSSSTQTSEILLPLDFNSNESTYQNDSNMTSSSGLSKNYKNDFTINRYRKKPDSCYSYFENEKEYLPCMSKAPDSLYSTIKLFKKNIFILFACYLILYFNLIFFFKIF